MKQRNVPTLLLVEYERENLEEKTGYIFLTR